MHINLKNFLAIATIVLFSVGLAIYLLLPSLFIANDNSISRKIIESTNSMPRLDAPASAEDILAMKITIEQINRKIDSIDLSISKLNENLGHIKTQLREKSSETTMSSNSPFLPKEALNDLKPLEKPTDWLSALSSGTRVKVDNVFKKNSLQMREAMKSIGTMDSETLTEVFENNQENLKNELRKVLSPDDYEGFLRSLPPSSQDNRILSNSK